MAIPSELLAAYQGTAFRVSAPTAPFTLRHGERSPELDRLLEAAGESEWAYITASNPGSRRLSATENMRRNGQLREHLDIRCLAWLPGEGVPDVAEWPSEESVLVLGMPLAEALALGRRFGQAAILAGRLRRAARVISCTIEPAMTPTERERPV